MTNSYAKDTIRGANDLTIAPDGTKLETEEGLDDSYITNWSYGLDESFTLLSPYIKGSHNSKAIAESNFTDMVEDSDLTNKDGLQNSPLYWGEQSITSGPVYLGVLVVFLALLGLVVLTYFVEYEEFKNLYFPFFKNLIVNLGWFFIPFSIFVIVGSSNAVNLTDGLDGLATVPVILVAGCFAFISYITGNIVFSEYLQILYIEGAGEISIFCGSIIGACLGFLWFNAPPAKIFMGDTGSLSLGGSLGAISIITKHEIVLAITGGLFVLEALSVLIQVISFKLTGRRIFKMAPIHHHFEKKGWPESTVVIRFWIISIILAVIGLATLKLR